MLLSTIMKIPILLLFAVLIRAQHPTCPHGQEPKKDAYGNQLQCLPGEAQKAMCGADHICFFSGLNYMCCPSNEPSATNQPTCPEPSITVLTGSGKAMQCSSRTRQCPEKTMTCTDVGSAFICCETPSQLQRGVGFDGQSKFSRKVKPTTAAPHSVECPAGSMGTLGQTGNPIRCSSRKPCQGYGQFCFGSRKYSICCEKFEFATNDLDSPTAQQPECPSGSIGILGSDNEPLYCTKSARCDGWGQFCHGDSKNGRICCEKVDFAGPNTSSKSPQRVAVHEEQTPAPYKPKPVSIAVRPATTPIKQTLDETAAVREPTLPEIDKSRITSTNVIKKRRKMTTTTEATIPVVVEETVSVLEELPQPLALPQPEPTAEATKPLVVFSTTPSPPPTYRPRAYAVNTNTRGVEEKIPLQNSRPSQLLNSQEKREMAQRILMHQIRNGWPYDDRFFRPDVDAFSPQQRNDIARLRFNDN